MALVESRIFASEWERALKRNPLSVTSGLTITQAAREAKTAVPSFPRVPKLSSVGSGTCHAPERLVEVPASWRIKGRINIRVPFNEKDI